MADLVYITGHRNPDTDSICAAIAYAELKKRLGVPAVAVRIGNVNKETKFVLETFSVPEPEYLESVRTQVSDLNMDVIGPVSADISIQTAWSLMQKNNIKVLPIVNNDGKLLGIVSLSDLTRTYMDTLEGNTLFLRSTPLRNITDTLKAKLVSGKTGDSPSTGKVVVAANAPDSMKPFVEPGDMVITGNRVDAQKKAVEIGASCVIVTCGAHVDPEVLRLAEQKGCVVMETGYDTFTASSLISQSIPVGFIMKTDLVCFHINDYVDSIRDRMLQTRYRSYPVVDDDGVIKGFISRYHLILQRKKKIILVDHNERNQTVDGVEQAEILEIIDHHRIADIQTVNPIYFRNDTVGSTATLIGNLYFENGVKPPKGIAGILCAAILSDTLKFKSPTTTYADTTLAEKLAGIAGIKIDDFAAELFAAGSALDDKMTPEEILKYDFKEFVTGDYRFGIGQIHTYNPQNLEQIQQGLLKYMDSVVDSGKYDMLLMMETDPVNAGSLLLFAGDGGALIEKAFGVAPKDHSVYLQGVLSRKKQVVPMLINAVKARAFQ